MQFEPKSENEINEGKLLPEGIYDFEVQTAEDKVSKSSGKEMIAITLRVWGDNCGTNLVNDYLMGGGMLYKLLHFCSVTGLMDKYEAGTLSPDDCIGRCGKVALRLEPAGQYPPKNSVKDYVVDKGEGADPAPRSTVSTTRPAANNAPFNNVGDDSEEIPF